MGWKFTLDGGKEVDLDRLPPAVFDELAREEPDSSWWMVYQTPGASTGRLWRLYVEACKVAEVDPGIEPSTLSDTISLLDRLERTEDADEKPMADGFPPTPDAPENGSSSGAPGDSDGLPMSPDDSPSEIS
jgi:hypothetical protein